MSFPPLLGLEERVCRQPSGPCSGSRCGTEIVLTTTLDYETAQGGSRERATPEKMLSAYLLRTYLEFSGRGRQSKITTRNQGPRKTSE